MQGCDTILRLLVKLQKQKNRRKVKLHSAGVKVLYSNMHKALIVPEGAVLKLPEGLSLVGEPGQDGLSVNFSL